MYKRIIISYDPHLKQLAKDLRKNMTLSEILLWDKLKNRQVMGFNFSRQRPLDKYIVDFYCRDLMLAIEIDGESHHHPEVQRKDLARQKRLEQRGVRFLRFDDRDVKQKMDDVLMTIQCWIEDNRDDRVGIEPTPYPSQEGT